MAESGSRSCRFPNCKTDPPQVLRRHHNIIMGSL